MLLKKMMEYLMKVMRSVEDVKLVLLTDDATDCAIFNADAEKSAVVDTACSKTVAGEQ